MAMTMLLHTINQPALVKSTDNSGNSCNMRARSLVLYTCWLDPSRDEGGYVLEGLIDKRVLVYWFSFDAKGNHR